MITVNGVSRGLGTATLTDLILEHAGSTRGSAIVVDGVVVPRSEWEAHTLSDGATVEIVTATQGG